LSTLRVNAITVLPTDEIWVEHRKSKEVVENLEQPPAVVPYAEQFRTIFESGCHSDVKFIVGEESVEIPAHRAILSARSEYFSAMFSKDHGMQESTNGVVRTHHEPSVFRRMLEFLYTNYVRDLATTPPNEVIALIMLANEYLLDDLRILAERAATRIISLENISRLMLLSAAHSGSGLREACLEFMRANKEQLLQDINFRQEVEQSPELGLFLFESTFSKRPAADDDDSPECSSSSKRRRIAENSETENDPVANLAATGSVPMTGNGLAAAMAAHHAAAAGATQVLPLPPPHIPAALAPAAPQPQPQV
jgi:hypothetical protein